MPESPSTLAVLAAYAAPVLLLCLCAWVGSRRPKKGRR